MNDAYKATAYRARVIRNTLGLKPAIGYCKKRVPCAVALYWLFGARAVRRYYETKERVRA